MRHFRLGRLALVASVALTPLASGAQAPVERPATHTVKRGDTLWDLAQHYLGDPFQWPQIYQLNKDLIKDPHWIYPNQVFRIPGGTATAPMDPGAPAPAPTIAGRRLTGPNDGMTIFNPARRRAQQAQQSRTALLSMVPRTAVRRGDFESAPYLWSDGGPADGGSLIGSAEPVTMAMTMAMRPLGYREHVIIELPRGVNGATGQRYLVYRLGPSFNSKGQVVIPTGIVQVSSMIGASRADAVLMEKFENVFQGHGVTALDSLRMPTNVFPTRVEFGLSTQVSWVYTSPMIVNEGQRLILDAASSQGLVPGDQVSLRVPSKTDPNGDDEIGVAQITRVTQWGASAVMLDVRDAGVTVGTRAQVSAKMP